MKKKSQPKAPKLRLDFFLVDCVNEHANYNQWTCFVICMKFEDEAVSTKTVEESQFRKQTLNYNVTK